MQTPAPSVTPKAAASSVDHELRALLSGYQAEAEAAADATETLTVQVRRLRRFTHEATTANGLSYQIDEPAPFGGTGEAADPAEQLLAAVGASLSVTLTAHAALRGLAVDGVGVVLSAGIDGRSFFKPRTWRKPGLLDMRIALSVTSPMSQAQARALFAETLRASPVYRSLKRRPTVTLTLLKGDA